MQHLNSFFSVKKIICNQINSVSLSPSLVLILFVLQLIVPFFLKEKNPALPLLSKFPNRFIQKKKIFLIGIETYQRHGFGNCLELDSFLEMLWVAVDVKSNVKILNICSVFFNH